MLYFTVLYLKHLYILIIQIFSKDFCYIVFYSHIQQSYKLK